MEDHAHTERGGDKAAGGVQKLRQRVAGAVASLFGRRPIQLAFFAKGVVIALISVVPPLLIVIVISKAMVENGVVMTALRVPQSLEAKGFTSETATQRLLDEIATLNRNSVAAKPRTNVGDTQLIDVLSSIETPAGNLDLRSFQSLIQRVLGKKITQISGEITTRTEEGRELIRLRLRQTPGREVLIDTETAQGPEQLFRDSAINLLEHLDPEIAAGIYFRVYGDDENALRLTAIALSGSYPGAEKYALNLRSYIYLARGQIDDAEAATNAASKLDPDFLQADYSKALILAAQKRFDQAIELSRKAVERDPDANSYNILGSVLSSAGQKEEAIDAYRAAIKANNASPIAYRRLAALLLELGRKKEASDVLLTAVAMLPNNPAVNFDYAADLKRQGRVVEAITLLRRACEFQPNNIRFQIALAEAELDNGQLAEASNIATAIANRIASGERMPDSTKQAAIALRDRLSAPNSPGASQSDK